VAVLVPTKRFWLVFAIGIPFAAFAAISGMPWLAFVFDALLVFVAYVTWRLCPDLAGLRFERRFDPVLSVRVQNKVFLKITNEGAESLSGRLRDEPPARFGATRKEFDISIAPGGSAELNYMVTPVERGETFFQGTFLRIACPLGLVEKHAKMDTEQPVRVYPNVLAMREFDFLNQKGKLQDLGIRKSRMRGLGSEFESLREYVLGDDFRKVDWKATARRGKLIVRQYEQERNQPVIICIDIGRRMLSEVNGITKLDYVLDSLLMLAQAVYVANDYVGLLVYSDVVKRYIPPRKGRNQLGFLIEAIHDLVAEPVESDPAAAFSFLASRWKRRSLIVSFTDVEDPSQAKALASAFGPMARRHLALIARVSDPRLAELVQAQIDNPDDLYLKASALLFVSDRREAAVPLKIAGLHNLEAEPQDLAAALVSFYFEVKEKALI
jgi:uncharacterized protein (DUF58 family)